MNNWINIFTCFIESIMIFVLYETFLIRRTSVPKLLYVIGVLSSTLMINISNYFYYINYLNILIMFLCFLIISFLYKGKIGIRIIISIFCVGLMGIAEVLVLFIMTIVYNTTVVGIVNNHIYVLVGTLISKMTAFLIIKIINLRYSQREYHMGPSYWLLFFIMFISAVSTIFLIFKLSYVINDDYMYKATVLCSIGLLLSVFFAIYLFEHMAKQNDVIRKQQQYEQVLNLQLKHLDEILITQKQIKKFKHDFSNYIIGLRSYILANDTSASNLYIDKLDEMFVSKNIIETGNTALDAIISTKKAIAESKSITFNTKINIPRDLNIDPIDICIIFGNALDNAIESCEKLSNNSDKEISLVIALKDNSLFCKIINGANPNRTITLKTSKSEKNYHGYGLENIKASLQKYNSEPVIEQTENQFILKFVIFL